MAESKYKFLNDRPVKEDAIGHYKVIADQLFETIHCNLDKPFVIGLFGSWGTGKSSIIEMLDARCKQEERKKTKIVVVDAWRKEKSIFNRQFLKKVARELFGEDGRFNAVRKSVDEITTESKSRWKPSPLAWTLFAIFVLAFIACSVVAIWGWYEEKRETNPFPYLSVVGSIVGILVACYFQLLLPQFSIGTTTEINDVSVHDIDHFRDIYFDKIIGKTEAQRVCIVVDNLDRVEAEDALAIMRTLKTFIVDAKEDKGTGDEVEPRSLNKVVFIVPCDDKELQKHIQDSNAVDNGTEFLQKLFNVSFRIPDFRVQDAFQYTWSLLDKMALDFDERHKSTICHIVSQTYCKNPRKAKIFLNNFLMLYNVAKACEETRKIEQGIITSHPDWLAISIAHKEHEQGGIPVYISNLRQEVSKEFWTALTYLKRPSDYEKIEGFSDLLKMAQQYDSGFSKHLAERTKESQNLIDAIWRNTDSSDFISHGNVIASIIQAIEINKEVLISSVVKDAMAGFIGSRYAQDMPAMSGKLVYERILKGKTEDIMHVTKNLGLIVNGIKLSIDRIKFSIEMLESILEDLPELLRRGPVGYIGALEQEIPKAIERFLILLGDAIIPIALRYPKYKSNKIFTRAATLCAAADRQIVPDNLVAYSISFDEASTDNTHNHIKETITALCDALVWYSGRNKLKEPVVSNHCMSILKSIRIVNTYAYNHNILPSQGDQQVLARVNMLFDSADDTNKLEIIEIFKDYEKFDKWASAKNAAVSYLNSRSNGLLESGSEDIVCSFIKGNHKLVNFMLQPIHIAAHRFKSVCHLLLNDYPERRGSIIPEVWKQHREWVSEWIEITASKIDRDQKQALQRTLFSIANSNSYPLNIYQSLSYVKIENDKESIDAQTKHFDNLIKSKELSKIDGLEFVLERIDKADYVTTNDQNVLLNNGWRVIDQNTAGSNLKQFVKKIIRT